LHIPDGVMPLWIIVLGWVVTGVLLALCMASPQRRDVEARLPLLGIISAVMLAAMSLELVPIGYHLNLTVVGGIVLGPALAFLAAFVVNLVLAFFGHGGITVVGLNTLLIGAEMILGYYLYSAGLSLLGGRLSAGLLAAGVTVLALATSTLLMIGIVGLSNVNPGVASPEAAAVEPSDLSFRNPFGEGVVSWSPFAGEADAGAPPRMDLATFAMLVLGLGAVGWVIEALITGGVVSYLAAVRPDLVRLTSRAGGS